jgi:cysteine-rich repeat protein
VVGDGEVLMSLDQLAPPRTEFDFYPSAVGSSSAGASGGHGYVVFKPSAEVVIGVCGDGVVQDGEECDDGNLEDGDGCDGVCTDETSVCSDGGECVDGCDVLFTYAYAIAPWGGDPAYDGSNGVLNDGVTSYYGDGVALPDWVPFWSWWNSWVGPSLTLQAPLDITVTQVGAYVSHGIGGGVNAPATVSVFHRTDDGSDWVLIGSIDPLPEIGWVTVPVAAPSPGGELRLDMTAAGEHTIVSELSVEGRCVE